MSEDGIRMYHDLTSEVRRITLEGGRERVHVPGAGLIVLLLVFAGVGFLAGWITGVYL